MESLLELVGGIKVYVLIGVAAVALAFAGGYGLAWRLQDGTIANMKVADAAARDQAVAAALKLERSQNKLSADAGAAAAAHQAPIEARAQIIRQEVPIYVTREADAGCVLPIGAFRLLDSAATGLPVDPSLGATGQSNDAPSGVDCSRFVALVADNFARYRAVAQQLNDLIDLAATQAAAAPATP